MRPAIGLAAALILAATLQAQTPADSACTALAQLQLPDTTVTTAEALTGGTFTVPGSTT